MRIRKHRKIALLIGGMALAVLGLSLVLRQPEVDFNTEVKPIINKKCISCHGGVKAKAGFSLLFREEALANTESGRPAIIPGRPDQSEMIRRLTLDDAEERMPYHSEPLSKEEIATFRRWIKQGAKWGDHWAYLPVQKVADPQPRRSLFGLFTTDDESWPQASIDRFIYQRLQKDALQFAPEASRPALLRRAAFDLVGMPPSDTLAAAFLRRAHPLSYEQLVDSLLASPHYGERWAAVWMDVARYADTKGYERDAGRSIWRYRDWLIKAFNEDKPYNHFLVEQLAGDLLPNATDEQWIATAFHRNTMTNDEGGTDNEEFRTAAVIDRVNTTWEGLMGTTFSCVQCHSHPYDPFKHEEYYRFLAFFNNTRDEDTWADYPALRHIGGADSARLEQLAGWLRTNGFAESALEVKSFVKTWQPVYHSLVTDSFVNCELNDTKWLAMRNPSRARLKGVDLEGRSELIFRYTTMKSGGAWTIRLDHPDGPVLKHIPVGETKPWGWQVAHIDFPVQQGVHDLYLSYSNPALTNPDENGLQFDWFYFTKPLPGKGLPGYAQQEETYRELVQKEFSATPVMMDNPQWMMRPTHVFDRGNWLMKGKKVAPAVPNSLNPLPEGAPRNRLGLALWLTDKKNPLTARTMVNRVWEQLFGAGLVETLEDLGTQGAEPTHRELLDHLSYRFMHEWNWSVKRLIKEIVLSQTYRQDSKVSGEVLEKDPFNKLYARSARVRLSAEALRDQALAASGLLRPKMYGPSVMPWQPGGIWLSPWNGADWKKSEGEDQYRRAIYTYWKRTAPYPSMVTFDGVGREVCTPRRIRTNTPLQALVTLNDSVFLEASRHLAVSMKEQGGNVARQISAGYERLLFQPISAPKLAVLQNLYAQALAQYRKDPDAMCALVGVNNEHNNPETAALIVVANALLNLDEVVTKS